MYTIEKGIPLPENMYKKFNFSDMDVGDCMLIPCKEDESERHRAANALTQYKRKTYHKFTTRYVYGEGLRIWRTE